MKFRINLTPSAEEDLRYFRLYEQKTIVAGIKSYLRKDADIESHRRKKLRQNELAPWELKVGKYRVFYRFEDDGTVKIVAIGHKEHNALFIRGKRVAL